MIGTEMKRAGVWHSCGLKKKKKKVRRHSAGNKVHFLSNVSKSGHQSVWAKPENVRRVCACVHANLLQLSPALCYPMDSSPQSSSVQGILQARILEWVAVPSPPGDLPVPGIKLLSPTLEGGFFSTSTTWEAHKMTHILFEVIKNQIFQIFGARCIQRRQ